MVTAIQPNPAERRELRPDYSPAALAAAIRRIGQGAAEREFNDENPFAAVDLVRESRLGALRVPVEHGGGGFSIRRLFATVIDLAEADPTVAHILRTHYWFVEERLRMTGGAARGRWLGEVGGGAIVGNASSELGPAAVGSLRFKTTITRQAGGYRLSGTKYYSTGTLFSDWVNVWAAKDENTLVSLVVPTGRAGVRVLDDWDGIGLRNTGSGTTVFERVAVQPDELLAEIRLDLPAQPTFEFAFLQLYLHAIIAGILRTVVTDAIGLLKGRERSFSHAPAASPPQDPILQQVVGQLSAAAFAAESAVLAAADSLDTAYGSLDNGIPDAALTQQASLRAAQVKVHVDELALRASTLLFEAGSASAASARKNLDRHWRAIRTLSLHNPTLYKAQAIGKLLILGEPLPANAYF
ncbi:MAG: acyl-CoA dehydrogenase family protein [Nevskia sp.]|nr:acyl-CoA dehydrogenase family protein [Nevskia sp.]